MAFLEPRTDHEGPGVCGDLCEGVEPLPDFRSRRGRRHPLPAILCRGTVAMLSGARFLEAVALICGLPENQTARVAGAAPPRHLW